jgi:cytochrome oxidase Cu insertion factor (SCO1/SenC/PrrC family)
MRGFCLFLLLRPLGGFATGFLATFFACQFSGYRSAIKIPGEQELADFTLTDQLGSSFTLSSVKGKAILI